MRNSRAQGPRDTHIPSRVFTPASGGTCYHPQLTDGKTDIHRPVCPRPTMRKQLCLGSDPNLHPSPYTPSQRVCSLNRARPSEDRHSSCRHHRWQLAGLQAGMVVTVTLGHPVLLSPQDQGDPRQLGAARAPSQAAAEQREPQPPRRWPWPRGWSPAEPPQGRGESGPSGCPRWAPSQAPIGAGT